MSYEMLTGLPAEAFPRLGQRARAIAADLVLAHLNRVAMRAARPRPRSGPEQPTFLMASVVTAHLSQ